MQADTARRADLWSGLFWIVLGGAIIAHAGTMPIPRHLGATVLTGPGLVPALLGGALGLLGAVLAIRGLRGVVVPGPDAADDPASVSNARALAALLMMVAYAMALALRQPFVPLTVAFVALFVAAFNWRGRDAKARLRLAAGALALGVATALTVEFVFERLFYVRLP